jgi:antitoxin component of MazEF toxin-antitoxin module
MPRRKLEDKNIRKLFDKGGSMAITIPAEMVNKLKLRKKQKMTVKLSGKRLIIEDWK